MQMIHIEDNPMPSRELSVLVNSLAELIVAELDREVMKVKCDGLSDQFLPKELLN